MGPNPIRFFIFFLFFSSWGGVWGGVGVGRREGVLSEAGSSTELREKLEPHSGTSLHCCISDCFGLIITGPTA